MTFGFRGGGKKGPQKRNGSFKNKAKLLPRPSAGPSEASKAPEQSTRPRRIDEEHSEPPTEDEDEEEDAMLDASKDRKPLEGVILAITGTDDERDTLLSMANDLGADASATFKTTTTHLICGSSAVFNPKYYAAIYMGCNVMEPYWIHAVRKSWMSGDKFNFKELEYKYRAQPFYGIQVVLTDFARGSHREDFRQMLAKGGAVVHSHMPISDKEPVHYLIVASPESPHSQMAPPDKYHFAKARGVQVVWEKWAYSTKNQFGRLPCCDEYWAYTPGQPEPPADQYRITKPGFIRTNALSSTNTLKADRSVVGTSAAASKVIAEDSLVMANKRKHSRLGKEAQEADSLMQSYRTVNRSSTATANLGEGPSTSQKRLRPSQSDSEVPQGNLSTGGQSLLRNLTSTKSTSFRPASPAKPKKIIRRTESSTALRNQTPSSDDDDDEEAPSELFFEDVKIFFANDHNASTNEKLQNIALENGAIVTTDERDIPHVDLILVSSTAADDKWFDPTFAYADKLATPAYMERCIVADARLPLGDNFFDRPFSFKGPVPGWPGQCVHIMSTPTAALKTHLSRLVRHTGARTHTGQELTGATCVVDCWALVVNPSKEELASHEENRKKVVERGLRTYSYEEFLETVDAQVKQAGLGRIVQQSQRDAVTDAMDGDLSMMTPAEESFGSSRRGKKRKLVEEDDSNAQPVPSDLFSNLGFYLDQTVKDSSRFVKLIESGGGVVYPSVNHKVSHYLSSGNDKRALAKVFKTYELDVVHPRWVEACVEAGRRVSEREYPRGYDERKGAQLSGMIRSPPKPAGSPPAVRTNTTRASRQKKPTPKQEPKQEEEPKVPDQFTSKEPVTEELELPAAQQPASAQPARQSSPPAPSSSAALPSPASINRREFDVPPSDGMDVDDTAANAAEQSDIVALLEAEAAGIQQAFAAPLPASDRRAQNRKRSKASRKRQSLADTSNGAESNELGRVDERGDLFDQVAVRPHQGFGFEGSQMSQFNEEESLQIRYADPVGKKEGEAIMAILERNRLQSIKDKKQA